MQGKFKFVVQQLYDRAGCCYKNWLNLMGYCSGRSYISSSLQEYSAWLSLGSSYEQTSRILTRQMGEQVLSDQSIYQIISTKAQQVSRVAKAEALGVLEQTDMPCIQSQIDLYDQKSEEVLLFEDGIQVKGQKLNRLRKATIAIDEFSTGGLSTDGLSTDGLSTEKE